MYDEKAIQTLDALEHIRLRTGMYIGRIGDGSNPADGIYVMLKEVIDNSIDEFIMGHGRKIEITRDGREMSVRDYGRGIPLGKVVDCVSKINTGGKYNDDVFQFSVGLNGVGNKAVNALSSRLRGGQLPRRQVQAGRFEPRQEEEGGERQRRQGAGRHLHPVHPGHRDLPRLRVARGVHRAPAALLRLPQQRPDPGLQRREVRQPGAASPTCSSTRSGASRRSTTSSTARQDRLEFAFTHTHSYGETYFSFVNGQYTNDGGTHQSAFREGVLKGVNEFAKNGFAGEDVRDGLIGAVAIKLQDPVFESQTKNKLGSTEVRSWIVNAVRDQVVLWLHKNPEAAEQLIAKVKNNERVRKELSAIKKEARERAKKVAIRIPKLIDCKVHLNDAKGKRREETMIFLTEGDSAGGAMIQARDVQTQAIYSLKGKPLNIYGLGREAVYKNEELYNIMRALGIEDSLDGLRYNRVVIATDADVDGMHIRNLLLTYFLRFFEELVTKATSSSSRRRCSGCATRRRRSTATPRPSATRPPRGCAAARSPASRASARSARGVQAVHRHRRPADPGDRRLAWGTSSGRSISTWARTPRSAGSSSSRT